MTLWNNGGPLSAHEVWREWDIYRAASTKRTTEPCGCQREYERQNDLPESWLITSFRSCALHRTRDCAEPLYRCPILEEMGAYDEQYSCGKYDPRHYDTLPDMIAHLQQNKWTEQQIADWQETARSITIE